MTKLSRQPDGSYSGTYKGQAFRVWKEGVEEQGWSGYRWSARSGSIEVRTFLGGTRDEAVRRRIGAACALADASPWRTALSSVEATRARAAV